MSDLLESHGNPIAADLEIQTADGMFAYQSGISPDHLHLEPGRLHNLLITQQSLNQGLRFIDYLRGDEAYKQQLRADKISCVEYEIASPKATSVARQGMLDLGRQIKAMLPTSSFLDA